MNRKPGRKNIPCPGDKEYIQLKIEAGPVVPEMYKQLDFAAKQNL